MKQLIALLGSLFLIFPFSLGLFAQDIDCTKRELPQQHLNYCQGLKLKKADDELNRTYKELVPLLPPDRLKLLQSAQLAWIGFRDKACEFAGKKFEGGSAEPYEYASCATEITLQRLVQLKTELKAYHVWSGR